MSNQHLETAAPFCASPDPHPRPPKLVVPPGATDTQIHIFGPEKPYPYTAEREYTPPNALPADYLRLRAVLGTERVVLVQPSVYGRNNRRLMDAASQLGIPTRMVLVLSLDDMTDSELERLHRAGARAVRFILAHPGGLPISDLRRVAERLNPMGWHIQFLLRPQDLIELKSTLESLASEFVIDHIGLIRASEGVKQPAFQALLELLRSGRCWVKLSGGYRISAQEPPYRDVIPLVEALVRERPDRLLWGTDWPHVMVKTAMPNTTALLDLLLEWIPDEHIRKQVLVDNPQKLFGFRPKV